MVRLGDGALCQFGEIAILHIELAALVHFRQKDEAFGELRHACDLLVDAFGPFALTVVISMTSVLAFMTESGVLGCVGLHR